MLVGAHIDNVEAPPDTSYRRIRLMRAEVALTLWTGGTRHKRDVYRKLREAGIQRVCIRVGDERIAGTVVDFLKDVDAAVNEAQAGGFTEDQIDVQILNEPNLSERDPAKVGRFVGDVVRGWRRGVLPVLPPLSRGEPGWQAYLAAMVGAYGDVLGNEFACGVHAYLTDAENIEPTAGKAMAVTEFSHPTLSGRERGKWVVERLKDFSRKGYLYAVQFIVDGKTGGAWPENYRMTDAEAVAIGERGPLPEPEVTVIHGMDVSNNQGAITWAAAAAQVDFALIKASGDETRSGRFKDPFFVTNWQQAGQQGLVRGAYHYGCPSVASAIESVTLFAEQIVAAGGLQPGDLIALDLEDPAVPVGQSLAQWTADWLTLAEEHFGVTPLLYTGKYYLDEHGMNPSDLGRFPLWLASYQDTPPPPPPGWSHLTIWQHDCHGHIPGIAGDVDLNVFVGTADEMRALGFRGESDVIQLSDADKAAVQAANDAAWSAAETYERVLAKYGARGISLGEWNSQITKGAVVNVKDACGLNAA